jgi:hypothetical protein
LISTVAYFQAAQRTSIFNGCWPNTRAVGFYTAQMYSSLLNRGLFSLLFASGQATISIEMINLSVYFIHSVADYDLYHAPKFVWFFSHPTTPECQFLSH